MPPPDPLYTYRPTEKQLRAASRLAARLRCIASRIADGEIPDITGPRSSFVNTMNTHAKRLETLIHARSPRLLTSNSLKRARVLCPQYEQCLRRGTIHGARLHKIEQQSRKINPTRFPDLGNAPGSFNIYEPSPVPTDVPDIDEELTS